MSIRHDGGAVRAQMCCFTYLEEGMSLPSVQSGWHKALPCLAVSIVFIFPLICRRQEPRTHDDESYGNNPGHSSNHSHDHMSTKWWDSARAGLAATRSQAELRVIISRLYRAARCSARSVHSSTVLATSSDLAVSKSVSDNVATNSCAEDGYMTPPGASQRSRASITCSTQELTKFV